MRDLTSWAAQLIYILTAELDDYSIGCENVENIRQCVLDVRKFGQADQIGALDRAIMNGNPCAIFSTAAVLKDQARGYYLDAYLIALRSKVPLMRCEAILALSAAGLSLSEALPILAPITKDENPFVAKLAECSILLIRGVPPAKVLVSLYAWEVRQIELN